MQEEPSVSPLYAITEDRTVSVGDGLRTGLCPFLTCLPFQGHSCPKLRPEFGIRFAPSGTASAHVPFVLTPEMLSDPCRGQDLPCSGPLLMLALSVLHLGLCISHGSPEKQKEKDMYKRTFIRGLGTRPNLSCKDQEPGAMFEVGKDRC